MVTSSVESSVATAEERRLQQQNAPNEYFYFFSQIDNIYRPYKTYFTTNILTHVLIAFFLFVLSFSLSVVIIYIYPLLGLDSQSITEIQKYVNNNKDISKPDGLPLCTIPQIQSVLSSLQGLFSLDKAKTLGTCVSMATIIGDNDPINILLALVALLATLVVAIAFIKESDSKTIVRRIANLSLSICWFVACFGGATILCIFNGYKMWGIIVDIALILISCWLMYTSNVINYEYGKELYEWKEKLNYYHKIYQQIIDNIPSVKRRISVKEHSFNVGRFSFFVVAVYRIGNYEKNFFIHKHFLNCIITIAEFLWFIAVFYPAVRTYLVADYSTIFLVVVLAIVSFLFAFLLSSSAAENDVLCALNKELREEKKRIFHFYIIVIVVSIFFSALLVSSLSMLSVCRWTYLYFALLFVVHTGWILFLFFGHCDWLFMSSRRELLTKDINNMDKELKYLDTIEDSGEMANNQ